MNRRQAITAIGVGGISAACTTAAAQPADVKDKVIHVGEKPVLFKVRNVTLDAVDEAKRTVSLSFGKVNARVKLTDIPLAEDIHILRWFMTPSIANNMPFKMERLLESVGKIVTILFRAEASGLIVNTIGTAND